MKMEDVAAELWVTQAQVYALVRNGSLPAIKLGGRGQWRIERSRLEEFIAEAYRQTAQFVVDNPFGRDVDDVDEPTVMMIMMSRAASADRRSDPQPS